MRKPYKRTRVAVNVVDLKDEKWKDVIGYEGKYMVSNIGRVKSVDRMENGKPGFKRYRAGSLMKPLFSKSTGYFRICLRGNSLAKTFLMHRLVAIHFIDNPNNKPEVNHKDGIKTNNIFSNLEWSSSMENSNHRSLNLNMTSSFTGVYFNKQHKKWRAQVYFNNKKKYLGSFTREQDAYAARVNFEKQNNIKNKYL